MNFYVAAILWLLHECDLDRETNVPKHMHDQMEESHDLMISLTHSTGYLSCTRQTESANVHRE